MKKFMAILAGSALVAGSFTGVYADNGDTTAEKLEELLEEASDLDKAKVTVSASIIQDEYELSAGAEAVKADDNVSLNSVYVKVPDESGITYDFELADVLRVINDNIFYLNMDSVMNFVNDLAEKDNTDQSEESSLSSLLPLVSLIGIPTEGWVRADIDYEALDVELDSESDIEELLAGVDVFEEDDSYTIIIDNAAISTILSNYDSVVEGMNAEDKKSVQLTEENLKKVIGKYVDAAVSGIRSVDASAVTDEQVEDMYKQIIDSYNSVSENAEDANGEKLAEAFDKAVDDAGIKLDGTAVIGKDSAAGSYAIQVDLTLTAPKNASSDGAEAEATESASADAETLAVDDAELATADISYVMTIEPAEDAVVEAPDNAQALEDIVKSLSTTIYSLIYSGQGETQSAQ